jgi:hypothetical protein
MPESRWWNGSARIDCFWRLFWAGVSWTRPALLSDPWLFAGAVILKRAHFPFFIRQSTDFFQGGGGQFFFDFFNFIP